MAQTLKQLSNDLANLTFDIQAVQGAVDEFMDDTIEFMKRNPKSKDNAVRQAVIDHLLEAREQLGDAIEEMESADWAFIKRPNKPEMNGTGLKIIKAA